MLKRHAVGVHARLATQVAIRPPADKVVHAHVVEGRIRPEAKVAIHQSETAPARHETAHDRPGHRCRFGKDLCEIVPAPHGSLRPGQRSQGGHFLAPDPFALGGAGHGDRASLEKPEFSFRPCPLHVARVAVKRFHAPAQLRQFRKLAVIKTRQILFFASNVLPTAGRALGRFPVDVPVQDLARFMVKVEAVGRHAA